MTKLMRTTNLPQNPNQEGEGLSLELFAQMVESLPMGVGFVDPAGVLRYANEALSHLFGGKLPREQRFSPQGEHYRFSPVSRALSAEDDWLLDKALSGRETTRQPFLLELASGQARSVLGSAYPLSGEEGVRGALFLLEEGAEWQERETWLLRFLSVLGHDIKNPLAAIRFSAEALRMRKSAGESDSATRAIDRIITCVERIAWMAEETLDLARLQSRRGLALSREPCDLRQVLQSALSQTEARFPEHSFVLSVAGNTEGAWDCLRMEQVFSELLRNAAKFSPPESPIEVTLRGEEDHITFLVQDYGPGIAAEKIPYLFTPSSPHFPFSKGAGLGLGLYIADHVVRSHHGQISVESGEGQGTLVRVVLPR